MEETSEFCQVKGDDCICGRSGAGVFHCKKPFSPERVREIMKALREHEAIRTGSPAGGG